MLSNTIPHYKPTYWETGPYPQEVCYNSSPPSPHAVWRTIWVSWQIMLQFGLTSSWDGNNVKIQPTKLCYELNLCHGIFDVLTIASYKIYKSFLVSIDRAMMMHQFLSSRRKRRNTILSVDNIYLFPIVTIHVL